MPRHGDKDGDGGGGAAVRVPRIRKRSAALSSSGTSSNPARKLRPRRPAVLLRRKGGGGGGGATPSPVGMSGSSSSRSRYCRANLADGGRSSARMLVGAFWQMDKDRLFGEEEEEEVPLDGDAAARRRLLPRSRPSTEVSKTSRCRSKILEADGKGSWHGGHGHWFSADVMSNGSAMEIGTCSHEDVLRCPQKKTIHLNDLHNSLIASKELVRVLEHIWGPGELNPSATSLISALHSELDVARTHVRRLIKEQKSEGNEVEGLKKQQVQEMESWKSKQKEKVANALQVIVSELDNEKKSRKRAERTNKKLGTALASTEASLRAATKELEKERRSKGRVEKIFSELIRGVNADKAEMEALKKETEKAQEDLQKEREMLQLANEWREQRVQMKLLEARLQFEEKNAAVNQLHDELQAYLDTKREQNSSNDQTQPCIATENVVAIADDKNNGECSDECEDDDDDSVSEGSDSDTHSIELNVDDNSKRYTWSYTPSKDRQRSATSRSHGSFSQRGMDDANSFSLDRKFQEIFFEAKKLREPNQKFQEMGEELEGDWADGCSDGMLNSDHDEERYQAIKNLREQMLAGSGFIVSQGRENAEREYCGL